MIQFTFTLIVQNNNNSRFCCWGGVAVAQDIEQVMSRVSGFFSGISYIHTI